jgi:hypothetical protein
MFNCEVVINGQIVHSKQYKRLSEICEALGMNYQQVADYSAGRVKKRATNTFIYHPEVKISKLPKSV